MKLRPCTASKRLQNEVRLCFFSIFVENICEAGLDFTFTLRTAVQRSNYPTLCMLEGLIKKLFITFLHTNLAEKKLIISGHGLHNLLSVRVLPSITLNKSLQETLKLSNPYL